MNSARSTGLCSAVGGSRLGRDEECGLVFSASRIRTTRGDIGNSGHRPRCESCSIARLSSRTGNVPSATSNSLTTTTSCQTTGVPKGWEEHGEMTIRTISKQPIGGAIRKKDLPDSGTDGRAVGRRLLPSGTSPRKSEGRLHLAPKQAEFWLVSPSLPTSSRSIKIEDIFWWLIVGPNEPTKDAPAEHRRRRVRSVSFQ